MEYLNPDKLKRKVHVWNEDTNDTYCSMWSTGGIDKSNYELGFQPVSSKICKNCMHVYNKEHE